MDKIKFAVLIATIQRMINRGGTLDNEGISEIDRLTINEPNKVNPQLIHDLLAAMKKEGFIEAIKAYRTLTGEGLKESKDAIEKYRVGYPSNAS